LLKRLSVLSVVLGLLTISGIALAADEDKEDTVFNFGYDEGQKVLVWNLSADDGLYDCSLSDGPLTTTYGVSDDGLVFVDGLTNGSEAVAFPARPQEELAEGLIAATGPVEYSGAEGDCGLNGGLVAGTNGQVNHGMFMKLFNAMFDGPGRGCVNRFLAQSVLGKGDQQLKVPDVDAETAELADGDLGSIDFETVLADCERGKEGEVTGQDKAAEKIAAKAEREEAKAEKKAEREQAKADRERGNSDSAPGKNK